ncbi:ras-associated guanine nucleotide exchange factor, putative [Bodo saltans]|uniref:Ras-associated guanine nucleotide exchange factor, putative n=1 Tax=Bodo saltans TaxID=75058 RepID=A0A0S4KGG1_BODSA|nr:ras-associated guanine nucleotide exchange factor, putative [Bodo saltans]|eukprot:CUI14764.1 ras-associated guanine nucleotide exchange factor, putative [Bodo saltans]
MKMFGLSEAHYLPTMSPIPFLPATALIDASIGAGGGASQLASSAPSPLTVLLAPHRATAASIHQLHSAMRESIMVSCPCIAAHVDVVPALEAAMVQPMWSEPPSDFFLLKRMAAPGAAGEGLEARQSQFSRDAGGVDGGAAVSSSSSSGKGKLVLATINQLVEQLTAVYFNPLTSRSQIAQDNANAFTTAFFRTYRLFLAPQALLSKLFQRFLVPSSLYVADHMDTRGIEFRCPPELAPKVRTAFGGVEYSARSAKWLKVSQLIKVKVLCMLHHWLKECPRHFDGGMLRMLMSFLEEQCFQPSAHADCPALIMQCAEFVKAAAAELLLSHISSRPRATTTLSLRSSGGGGNRRGVLAFCPIGVRNSVPPTLAGLNSARGGDSTASGGDDGNGGVLLVPTGLIERLVAFHAHTQRSKGSLLRSGGEAGSGEDSMAAHNDPRRFVAAAYPAAGHPYFDPEGIYAAVVREFLDLPIPPVVRAITGCSRLLFRSFDVEAFLEVAILGDVSSVNKSPAVSSAGGAGRMESSGGGGRGGVGRDGGRATDVSVEVFVTHAERLMHWAASLVLTAAGLDAAPSKGNAAQQQQQQQRRGAAASDENQSNTTTSPLLQAVLYRLVELATELMEQNDLHSAFGLVAGLNHPAIARLHRPLFSKRFMFHERIETLIDFFDLSTAKYANYMSHLPDDDIHPPVPFVHQCIEEMRALHDTAPSYYRVPPRHHSASVPQGGGSQGSSGSDGAGGWVPSEVVIHWRKFQALEGMLGDLIKYQAVPVSHGTYVEIQMMYGGNSALNASAAGAGDRGGKKSTGANTTTNAVGSTLNAATVARVGAMLESHQWAPDRMITDAAMLAQLSLMVHDPTRVD